MLANGGFATLIPVRNMDRAVRFYTKTLGGKIRMRPAGEMADFWASLTIAKANIWLIRPEKPEKRKFAYSTFLVSDIRREVKALVAKGVKFTKAEKVSPQTQVEGPIAFEPFGASAYFWDSEGNLQMLWQDQM
jgi:predicted enzyme related to lactoylglutathione lyase